MKSPFIIFIFFYLIEAIKNFFVKSLGMTKEDENIPAADQSLEGMINEAFGTVAVTKLDDFKTGKKNAFSFTKQKIPVFS